MSDWKEVPDCGLLWPLQVRTGKTFGPFVVELGDAAREAYALTGATLYGRAWSRSAPDSPIALAVAFTDAGNTKVSFYLSKLQTSALTGAGSFFIGKAAWAYEVGYADGVGVEKTLVYGPIDVLSGTASA